MQNTHELTKDIKEVIKQNIAISEIIIESKEVLERKNIDENFRIVINEIKIKIEQIHELLSEEYFAEIFIKEDFEIPSWKKTIINFKIKNKTFEEKIALWESIDKQLREVIKNIKRSIEEKGGDTREIEDINKNLFIRVNLMEE